MIRGIQCITKKWVPVGTPAGTSINRGSIAMSADVEAAVSGREAYKMAADVSSIVSVGVCMLTSL